jgi:acetylornithine deacetylase/succinyl-diaminopimelate desuccinylase family protein
MTFHLWGSERNDLVEPGRTIVEHLAPERASTLLADLVRIRSQNSIDAEVAVAEYIAGFVDRLGLEVEVEEVSPGRPNVIARLVGAGGPSLTFNSHMDTVPEGAGWTRGPFDGSIVDRRLYGRGAVDAKGSLAAILAAIEAFVLSGVRLGGDVSVSAVVDEEAGSAGARALTKHFVPDFAIVGEPTSLEVVVAHRGSLRPVIVVHGRTAHSSVPSAGENAIYRALPVIEALRSYALELNGEHPLCGSPSGAVTVIGAGVGENVIPDRCEIIFDRRMIPGEVEELVREEIEAVLAKVRSAHPEVRVAVERHLPTTGPSSEMDPSSEFVRTVQQAVVAAGGPGTLAGMTGACDMTHFRAAGVATVALGPGDPLRAHEPDENIDVDELHRGAIAYAYCALAICGEAS